MSKRGGSVMERNIARVRAMTDEEIVSRIGRKMREFVAKTPHASYPKDLADVQAFNLLYREACRKNIFTKKYPGVSAILATRAMPNERIYGPRHLLFENFLKKGSEYSIREEFRETLKNNAKGRSASVSESSHTPSARSGAPTRSASTRDGKVAVRRGSSAPAVTIKSSQGTNTTAEKAAKVIAQSGQKIRETKGKLKALEGLLPTKGGKENHSQRQSKMSNEELLRKLDDLSKKSNVGTSPLPQSGSVTLPGVVAEDVPDSFEQWTKGLEQDLDSWAAKRNGTVGVDSGGAASVGKDYEGGVASGVGKYAQVVYGDDVGEVPSLSETSTVKKGGSTFLQNFVNLSTGNIRDILDYFTAKTTTEYRFRPKKISHGILGSDKIRNKMGFEKGERLEKLIGDIGESNQGRGGVIKAYNALIDLRDAFEEVISQSVIEGTRTNDDSLPQGHEAVKAYKNFRDSMEEFCEMRTGPVLDMGVATTILKSNIKSKGFTKVTSQEKGDILDIDYSTVRPSTSPAGPSVRRAWSNDSQMSMA